MNWLLLVTSLRLCLHLHFVHTFSLCHNLWHVYIPLPIKHVLPDPAPPLQVVLPLVEPSTTKKHVISFLEKKYPSKLKRALHYSKKIEDVTQQEINSRELKKNVADLQLILKVMSGSCLGTAASIVTYIFDQVKDVVNSIGGW